MTEETYRYCKVFVQRANPHTVTDLLTDFLGAQSQHRLWKLVDAVVDVSKNPDTGAADDFIGWPTIVEIEAEAGASSAAVVAITSRVVTAMWGAGLPAVAACDYEDELPWRGGLGR
jgi:hypothetical protein